MITTFSSMPKLQPLRVLPFPHLTVALTRHEIQRRLFLNLPLRPRTGLHLKRGYFRLRHRLQLVGAWILVVTRPLLNKDPPLQVPLAPGRNEVRRVDHLDVTPLPPPHPPFHLSHD